MTLSLRSTDPGRASTAVDELSVLYPSPLQVSEGAPDTDVRARFIALPSARQPRIVVTAESPATASRALRRQLNAPRMRTQVARVVLGTALRSGTMGLLPGSQLTVHGPPDAPSIEQPLREVLQTDVRLAMPVGPPRATHKPVLQITDVQGEVLAYAKVGHNALTRDLVRQEAEILNGFDPESWSTVRPPGVMALKQWRDLVICVLEPLSKSAHHLTGRGGRDRLLTVVDEISAAGGITYVAWGEHPLRARLEHELVACDGPADALLEQWSRLPTQVVVPTGCWHGDLNPGNLVLTSGRCPVWDWERFGTGVPVGFDLLHHDLHRAITVSGRSPRYAAQVLLRTAPATLARWGVSATVAKTIAAAYLLTVAQRYLADDQRNAGAQLGRVEDWLLPALQAGSTKGAIHGAE